MAAYDGLILEGPPGARSVLVSHLVDILERRINLLAERGMDQSVGFESICLMRGSYSELQSILKRLTDEHA
jgi:hypothetical protein